MSMIVDVGKHPLSYMAAPHTLPTWEFIYCTGGSGTMIFEEKEQLEFSRGVIISIPPNTLHASVSKSGFTNLYVSIRDAILYRMRPFAFRDDRGERVLSAFQAAYQHFEQGNAADRTLLRAYSYLIMTYAKCYHKNQLGNETAEEILDNITENYTDVNYELDQYLASLPFSDDYIRKLFKSEIGTTPHRYLMDLRLEEAAGWLNSQGREANVGEISRRCGFREPLYFSKMFKKKFGLSPSHYAMENERTGRAEPEKGRITGPDEGV